ncbi:iron ABC transporter permease [Variovorax paradoxus]|uniref:FecCD family ABC transporter permease n=1 Tax=Variovorax paradoxus TaxID=34073 RepID=UPI0024798100
MRHASDGRRASMATVWLVLLLLLAAAVVLALSVGAATVWPTQWWGTDTLQAELVRVWRAPRVAGAFFVGACLSLAGLVFQGVFRNPLAEPYLLGSASGAAVGAAVSLLLPALVPTALSLPVLAFAGAWGASWLVLLAGRLGGGWQSNRLLLAGVGLAAILAALRSLIVIVFGDESTNLRAIISWQLGGVQTPTSGEIAVLAPVLLVLVLLVRALGRGLDALGLGEDTAHVMGVRAASFSARAVLVASLATALAVSWGGLIGFVGLIVPHVMRWWIGPLHARLTVPCAIAGGGLMVLVDALARSAMAPSEIPAGLLTALIGGPFFLALLLWRRG